jgi:hypothetical protein
MEGTTLNSIDMEKAFDRVEHDYLFGILDHLNLGNYIKNYIKTIYRDIKQIKTPSGYTEKIALNRGIRQGCGLSMTLFTISIEPFLQYINHSIKGLSYSRHKSIKYLAYADDTVIMTKDDQDNITMGKIIDKYQKASGA